METTKKFYVIASTEHEANNPDMFLMDAEGNYFGVGRNSYVHWHKFPKSIEHWKNAECSDAGRYFNIDEVELPLEKVELFDELTKEYARVDADMPIFDEDYPIKNDFKTEKAYHQAVEQYWKRFNEWDKVSNFRHLWNKKNELWRERKLLFISFSKAVYEAIKGNFYVKKLCGNGDSLL